MGVGKPTGSTAALGENKPKQIGTSNGWYAIASGSGHVLALGSGSGTAVNEYSTRQDVLVYPNPASAVLHVSVPGASLTIRNVAGQYLYSGSSATIAIDAYPAGIYFYQLILKDGNTSAGTFYKQ